MNTIIIGGGEIGKSLQKVLEVGYKVSLYDVQDEPFSEFLKKCVHPCNILHICFPFNDKFIDEVDRYSKILHPQYVVIHSTVPVGTSTKCNAIHSPCVGIHPHLAESLKTFTKFLGGPNSSDVADYFRRVGVKVHIEEKSETTELLKIQCTTFYGICIEFNKEMRELCNKYDVPYDSWLLWSENYNKGYKKLGYPEYKKPTFTAIMGKQGGHCVGPNLRFISSKFANFLRNIMGNK